MIESVFFKGWTVGSRLRGHSAAAEAAGAGGGGGEYDRASFLAGLAAGFASRGAPPWGYTREHIVADAEYLLPIGPALEAGELVRLGRDFGGAEYLLPIGPAAVCPGAVERLGYDYGRAEELLAIGPAIEEGSLE